MINVEELLKPVSDDKPCGEDFSYNPAFQNLESIARGKPETQFSSAEEPQWKEVRDAAVEVLTQSKHLGAAVILTLSLLKTEGMSGLRDGFAVTRGLIEKFWPGLYPALDPDDNNDPTERLNILNNLSSNGEPYRFLHHLRQMVICTSTTMGRITLQQCINAKEKAFQTEGSGGAKPAETGPDMNQVQAAFQEAGVEAIQATFAIAQELIAHEEAMDSFLETTLGFGKGANFTVLKKLFTELKSALEPFATGGDSAAANAAEGSSSASGESDGATPAGPSGARAGNKLGGAVQTRADVIKALELIYDYYKRNEPSSPVPFVLKRAERLVDKDFMAIVKDLSPDSLKQLHIITGIAEEGS